MPFEGEQSLVGNPVDTTDGLLRDSTDKVHVYAELRGRMNLRATMTG